MSDAIPPHVLAADRRLQVIARLDEALTLLAIPAASHLGAVRFLHATRADYADVFADAARGAAFARSESAEPGDRCTARSDTGERCTKDSDHIDGATADEQRHSAGAAPPKPCTPLDTLAEALNDAGLAWSWRDLRCTDGAWSGGVATCLHEDCGDIVFSTAPHESLDYFCARLRACIAQVVPAVGVGS